MNKKGDFNQDCNRTSCANSPATFYNHSTRKYYCTNCAADINEANYRDAIRLYGHELCTPCAPSVDQENLKKQELISKDGWKIKLHFSNDVPDNVRDDFMELIAKYLIN
jgi:hypothetical protein